MDIQESIEPVMETRTFGRTGMQVSMLGLGGHELNLCSDRQAHLLIRRALETGFNVIDTAECYGESEERIGQSLGAQREKCYIFTKCGHNDGLNLPPWTPQIIEYSIERSLQRLRTDYIDLVLLHSCSLKRLQQGDVITSLQKAQQAGKVRFIGYSGDREAARFAANSQAFDALEFSLNIADQSSIEQLLPLTIANGMGVIAKRPLANMAWKKLQTRRTEAARVYKKRLEALRYDFLQSEDVHITDIALRFTTSVPGVHTAIVGTTNPDHLEANVFTLAAGPLLADDFAAIRARWQAVARWRKILPGGRLSWQAWI